MAVLIIQNGLGFVKLTYTIRFMDVILLRDNVVRFYMKQSGTPNVLRLASTVSADKASLDFISETLFPSIAASGGIVNCLLNSEHRMVPPNIECRLNCIALLFNESKVQVCKHLTVNCFECCRALIVLVTLCGFRLNIYFDLLWNIIAHIELFATNVFYLYFLLTTIVAIVEHIT